MRGCNFLVGERCEEEFMAENDELILNLSRKLLTLMLNENIAFEKKKGKMDYLVRIGADVNANVYGKKLALWVKELGDEEVIKYIKEKGGVESQISKEKRDELGCQFWDKNGEVKSFKEIKELVLMGADLSVKNNKNRQIWKYLSLEEMNEVLKDLPESYVIEGDVDLSDIKLTELPDFSKIKVGGDFYCEDNKLTDLKGVPRKVGGDFDCNSNRLISLEGAPREVGGSFNCTWNQLTTLKGAPEKVGRNFGCYENQLTTLQGAPSEVGGYFDCSQNKLKVLTGAPSRVGKDFDCGHNQLTTLESSPSEVGGDFDCSRNQLVTLEGKPKKIGGKFKIEEEVLARIEELEKQKKNNAVMGAMTDKFEM